MAVTDTPFHLRGNFAPVSEEVTTTELKVTGTVPDGLNGLYVRNGPNPRAGSSPHWFFGDGMLHGLRFDEGRAGWYRNRWVQTKMLENPEMSIVGDDGSVDRAAGPNNTHVVAHAGKILALVETGYPCEMSPELETVGPHTFGDKLATGMTAHPKICPVTGEMHFFGYGFAPPYLVYHVVDASGELVHSEEIEVGGPTMIHDFSITEKHVIFMDLPVVFDLEEAMAGRMPYAWSDDYPARMGVMPRGGSNAQVNWVDVDPCYVFHPLNSYDDGDQVVLDAARYPELWRRDSGDFEASANLHRWRINVDGSGVKEEQLDDLASEFPRVDERRVGLRNRYGWAVSERPDGSANLLSEGNVQTVVGWDLETGDRQVADLGAHRSAGEPVMVPRSADAAENDGWLLFYTFNAETETSDLTILNADDVAGDPVATVHLPVRVPVGFHGSFIPD